MEIRIGIVNAPRELSFESADGAEEVAAAIAEALENKASLVRLRDDKGNVYLVPAAGIAYVEVGTEETRHVGFVA